MRPLVAALFVLAVAPFACVVRPRLCTSSECTPGQCVAGRCQGKGAPEISKATTRRLVLAPTDLAYVTAHNHAASPAEVPPIVVLGRTGESAALLLRFQAPIAQDETVVEAYLLLDRAEAVQSDPANVSLHAARIIDPWDARSMSWERQPRWEETGSPETFVTSGARPMVRIDVRDLVTHWKMRDPRDQGLAVVASTTSTTGMAFAATSDVVDQGPTSMLGASPPDDGRATWVASPPRLELYLKPEQGNKSLTLPVYPSASSSSSMNPSAFPSSNGSSAVSATPSALRPRPHK